MKRQYHFLRFGEGHTSTDLCKPCKLGGTERPATGIGMVNGWFPIYACDEHDLELQRGEATAIADELLQRESNQEYVA